MADADPQATPEPSRRRADNGDRRRPSAPAAERPAEGRSFVEEEPALDIVAPNPMTIGASWEVEHELVQLSQQVIRAGRQAFNEAMAVWRESLEPIAAARTGMGRWYEDLARQATGFGAAPPLRPARPSASAVMTSWMGGPAIDLKELPEAYRLEVEVPGVDADDLDVLIKDGLLIVSGQKTEVMDGGAYQISERRYGRFERAVPLPDKADGDRIKANLDAGVLTVTLPKKAALISPPNRVPIGASRGRPV